MSAVPLQPAYSNQVVLSLDNRAIPNRPTSPIRNPTSQTTLISRIAESSGEPSPKSTLVDPPSPDTSSDSQPDTAVEYEALRIVRIAPQDVQILKYHRSVYYPSNSEDSVVTTIEPLQVKFERERELANWTEIRLGKPYFWDSQRSLLTRSDLYDEGELVDIQLAANTLVARLDSVREKAPRDTELVIAKTWSPENNAPVIGYYLASMSMQAVFWLDDPDSPAQNPIVTNLVTDWGVRAVVSQPHLGQAIKWQFWIHVETFPAHRPLPSTALQELRRAFNFGLCDSITSTNSMFPFDSDTNSRLAKCLDSITAEELDEMTQNVNLPSADEVKSQATKAKDETVSSNGLGRNRSRTGNGEGAFIIARLLSTLHRERFLSFWGEPGARLNRSESALEGAILKRSLILKLVSPIFFFMPFLYMQEFDKLWVDQTIHYHSWRIFIDGLKTDWDQSITPATVLIATNIGFLSIGSIDGDGMAKNSAAQIMSYISTILAAFIYIVCQILQRHHRHHVHGQATEALGYIQKREGRLLGLEAVAIAFSIPTALFLWSMITFLVAMMIVFFDHASLGTRLALGVLFGLMLLVMVLLLYLESEGSFRGTFNIAGLAGVLCRQVSAWWQAHPLRRKTPSEPADHADAETESGTGDTTSSVLETQSQRTWRRTRTWLSRSEQATSPSERPGAQAC